MNTTDKSQSTYTGNEDTSDAVLTGMRVFSVALGHILKHGEAVCVTLQEQPGFPNDRSGRFVAFKRDSQIMINFAPSQLSHVKDGEIFVIDETGA